MRDFTILSVLMTVVLLTMIPGSGFATNDDPLFCVCVPVDDDGTLLGDVEEECAAYASTFFYDRWNLRSPQKGELFDTSIIIKIPSPAYFCNTNINGVAVCQSSIDGVPAEPSVCAGAPAAKEL